MSEHYSEIFKTERKLYRYNYETQKIEELKKVIRKTNQRGVIAATVQLDVVQEFPLEQSKFEENPLYWLQLYESAKESR